MNMPVFYPYRVPSSSLDALGFVTENLEDSSWTWAWPNCFSYLVSEAEKLVGAREKHWLFCGIKFQDNQNPCIFQLPGNPSHVCFVLTLNALREPDRCYFQMAHEVVHFCILRQQFGRPAITLEEGLATIFCDNQSLITGQPLYSSGNYAAAAQLTAALLERNKNAIIELRSMVHEFSDITYSDILKVAPDLPEKVAISLASQFGS